MGIGFGRIPFFLAVLLLWVSAFSGCAGLGRFQESPRISLAHIEVQETKTLEAVFLIQLRIVNVNDSPIVTKGLDCQLEVNGKRFASGVSSARVEVPALGSATIPVVVYSSVIDMVRGILTLPGAQKLRYRLSGRLHAEGGFLLPLYMPFKSEGEMALGEKAGATP